MQRRSNLGESEGAGELVLEGSLYVRIEMEEVMWTKNGLSSFLAVSVVSVVVMVKTLGVNMVVTLWVESMV